MEHGASELLVEDYSIDNDERLRIDVERVDTVHEHHPTDARRAIAVDDAHVCTKPLLHLVLDGDGIGVPEVGGAF